MFVIIRKALQYIWEDLFTAASCNLLWLLSQALFFPGPPATLALFYTANRIVNGEVTDVGDFLRAVRRFWGLGWRWGLANLALVLILTGDYYLTGQLSQSAGTRFIQGFYLALLGIWLLTQFYSLPFLFEQEEPSLRQALRNGVVLIGRNIFFTVGLTLTAACVLLLGVLLFMLSGAAGGIFLALVSNQAVISGLDRQRAAKRQEQAG